jgi:hypothetical protein
MSWGLQTLQQVFPSINWREPIEAHWPDKTTYCCRVCIANLGLHRPSKHQWDTPQECLEHIRREHT